LEKRKNNFILDEIDKAIRATARTITRTKLTDKVRSEVTLSKAGLKSLTEAVSVTMATLVWKARKDIDTSVSSVVEF
jgi:hypothetical protein